MHTQSNVSDASVFGKALPAASVLVSLLAISSALERSAAVGRLAGPPAFDDVSYFISGFDLYSLYLEKGLSGILLPTLHQHAPFQSLLAMVGNLLFGVGPWSAYLANGFLVLGLVLVLLVFTRSLQPIGRFAIILYVISLPLVGNLVTEFRPDICWGMLCGIAIYLMLNPTFLVGRRVDTIVPAIFVGLALLGKPSASPATAALMMFTALLAIWLQRPLLSSWKNVGAFVLVVLVIVGPFFALNAAAIYWYIHQGLVEQYGIFDEPRSFWADVFYYSNGFINRFTLSSALWIGISLFVLNLAFLHLNGRRDDLSRYVCFAFATLVAYLIPTISPIKSPFFGSIFYGTFLLFLVQGLVLAFGRGLELAKPVRRTSTWGTIIGPAMLIFFTAVTFHGWTLLSEPYVRAVPEWNKAAEQLTAALEKKVTASTLAWPATVFVTAPYPLSHANISLLSRWHGLKMEGDGGYYLRSIEEEREHALRADFVLISEESLGRLPGAKLGLILLDWIKSSDDFELVTEFSFANGHHAYLFRKLATYISAGPGDWIEHKGLILKVEADDLARRPFIVFDGLANYQVLGGKPELRAVLTTAPSGAEFELPARLVASGQRYEAIIDTHTVTIQPGQQYSIKLTFDRYFVPKALGINDDTRELVVMMPAKVELRQSPPVDR